MPTEPQKPASGAAFKPEAIPGLILAAQIILREIDLGREPLARDFYALRLAVEEANHDR